MEEDEDDVNSVDNKTVTSRTHSVARTKKSRGGAASTVSFGSSKSSKSLLGYQPVPTACLDYTIEHITRWLNYHVLQTPIAAFPTSVIESNGHQIFDLITFLTGRTSFSYRVALDHQTKRAERVTNYFYHRFIIYPSHPTVEVAPESIRRVDPRAEDRRWNAKPHPTGVLTRVRWLHHLHEESACYYSEFDECKRSETTVEQVYVSLDRRLGGVVLLDSKNLPAQPFEFSKLQVNPRPPCGKDATSGLHRKR